ncbi:MAG: serine protein kinase RIO [Thermoplasmatales archaeon]|nr:MAG: serine protein kinase RIO [Thermoplasmatales archaeon]
MFSDNFLDEKRLKKLDREIQHLIDRTGTDRKTEEEVFDKTTLHTLEKLISDKVIDNFDFPISTGKEGNVFRAVRPDKSYVAIKIYRTSNATFKHISKYITGDPRFKSMQNNRRGVIYVWTKKEFKNLERLQQAGIKAPKPITYSKNVLVMGYIGEPDRPAPMLKDVELEKPMETFDTIIKFISRMYKKAKIVHTDMSAFNILMYKNEPYLIDLGQGVLLEHPNAHEFLKRDIHNMVSYFNKFGIQANEAQIYGEITDKSW